MENVQEIVLNTRRTGNTTWILNAAINEPNCIIIAKNEQHANDLRKRYYDLLMKQPWYKKIYWNFFGKAHPRFMSINNRSGFAGYKIPVIFDNGTFC